MADINDIPLRPIGGAQPLNDVPVTAATPQPETTNAGPTASTDTKPTEIFQDLPPAVAAIPAVRMLAIGEPPAFRVEPGQYFPELEPLGKDIDKVLQGGLDIFKTQGGEVVVYNPLFIGEAELKQADATGKLGEIIPPYGELSGSEPQEVSDEKFQELVQAQDAAPSKMQALSVEEAPQQAAAQPPPAKVQGQINSARVQNVKPQAPTSGPAPGSGRVLNGLLKRAV